MYTIRKLFKFEGAHQLSSAYSDACMNVHGHSYRVEVIISSDKLNEDGMVIDFGELKGIAGPVIDELDHKFLYDSVRGVNYVPKNNGAIGLDFNPTAENLCKYIWEGIAWSILNHHNMQKLIVRLHETDTGYAEYTE